MSRRTATALSLAAVAALAAASPAAGASRTLTLEGWPAREMAFSGDHLVWTEAATVRVDPRRIAGSPPGAVRFDYYRAETSRVRLAARGTRFAGAYETPVSVRTSIAAMSPGVLSPTGDGGFVMAPTSRRFAAPVVLCCDADGVETVVESDGGAAAPVTVGAAWAAPGVRYVQVPASGVGPTMLRSTDGSSDRALGVQTAPGLVAVTPLTVGLVEPTTPRAFRLLRDGAGATEVALPGPALRVWGSAGVFAIAIRVAGRVALLRIDDAPGARPVRVWNGARLPRVAVGGGAIAIGDGRRVLASRRGPLRLVMEGRRAVEAVGVDGGRVAWVERGLRRGARVGVVRLGRVP